MLPAAVFAQSLFDEPAADAALGSPAAPSGEPAPAADADSFSDEAPADAPPADSPVPEPANAIEAGQPPVPVAQGEPATQATQSVPPSVEQGLGIATETKPATEPTGSQAAPPPQPSAEQATGGRESDSLFGGAATATTAPTVSRTEVTATTRISKADDQNFDEVLVDGSFLMRRQRKGVFGAPNRNGFTGMFRAISAEKLTADSFRFGVRFSGYTLSDHWDGASQSHLDGVGFFTYSILEDLEARIAGEASGHSSGAIPELRTTPLFQMLGDVRLGVKYVYTIPQLPFINTGGTFDFQFFTRAGDFGLRGDTFSFLLNAIGTINWLDNSWFKMEFPLRTHLNLGFFLDNSRNILKDVPNVTASTRFGLGVSPGHQFLLVFGNEYFFAPYSVYLEYSTEQVVSVEDPNVGVNKWTQSPQRFTPGFRYNVVENLLVDAAADFSFGLQAPMKVGRRIQPSGIPYRLNLGVSYEYNPQGFDVVDVRGKVQGIVVDADTGEAIGGAIVEYLNADLTPQVSDETSGVFETYKLPKGQILLKVTKKDYEPLVLSPEVVTTETVTEKIFLRRMAMLRADVGALVGKVLDSNGNPLEANIEFLETDIDLVLSNPADGGFIKILPEGEYKVRVSAKDFAEKTYKVPVYRQKKTRVVFQLISGEQVGAIAGVLLDEQNRPLAGQIRFLDAQVEPVVADATGQFMKILPQGKYMLEVLVAGFMPQRFNVPVEVGKKTTMEIKLTAEEQIGALAGRVLNSFQQPIPAVLQFADPNIAPVPVDPETGQFNKTLKPGNYEITIQAPGYEPKRYRIPVLRGKKTVQDFVLEAAASAEGALATFADGRIMTRTRIEFEPGSTLLTEDSYPLLNDVAKVFLGMPRGALRVEGHTNNLGPASANLKLSQERAKVTGDYLISVGVPQDRIKIVGYGEDKPVAPNDTVEGRASNERMEFYLE